MSKLIENANTTVRMELHDALIEPYFIKCDEYNYTLLEKTGRQNSKGVNINKMQGHYTSVGHALNRVILLKTEDLDVNYTVKSYVEALNNNRKLILAVFEAKGSIVTKK